MAELPQEFAESTRLTMGRERFERYLKAFEEEPPVSIRLNPRKAMVSTNRPMVRTIRPMVSTNRPEGLTVVDGERVPWCQDGYYLKQRPAFTMDPLLHAGCYYVQEAASMFLDEVLRQQLSSGFRPLTALDLCAAPGGKSTLMRAVLPEECTLVSNEPIRQRASILEENVRKWGGRNHTVTSQYAKNFRASKSCFDVILADVPCSGEGMFRKDPATIQEWSPQHVERCWQLQRSIVSDIWPCLRPGGLFIYSTCTFNTKENEENIRWIIEEYDAEVMPVSVKPEWNITSSLLEGFTNPVYRFIPGISRGEGLFMCVLRKAGASSDESPTSLRGKSHFAPGKVADPRDAVCGQAALSYQQAIAYLRGEALVLPPDTPRGIVEVTFMGHPLGLAKNIGTRANNLYPKPWRIKTTHIPNEYEAILRHT